MQRYQSSLGLVLRKPFLESLVPVRQWARCKVEHAQAPLPRKTIIWTKDLSKSGWKERDRKMAQHAPRTGAASRCWPEIIGDNCTSSVEEAPILDLLFLYQAQWPICALENTHTVGRRQTDIYWAPIMCQTYPTLYTSNLISLSCHVRSQVYFPGSPRCRWGNWGLARGSNRA